MESKEEFIKYLQELYDTTNKPLLKGKILKKNGYLCNAKLECDKYGDWKSILEEANLPSYYNEPKEVECTACNIKFIKRIAQIKRTGSGNHFCSKSCSAKYNNSRREMTEEHKKNISNGLKKYAEEKFVIPFKLINASKICEGCKKEFEYDNIDDPNRKYCGKKCGRKYGGKKGGTVSASKQKKRSKAEMLFADMCMDHFGKDDILMNESLFEDKNGNFWDCDIYIKSLKIAILYNGIWHYKKVTDKTLSRTGSVTRQNQDEINYRKRFYILYSKGCWKI